MAAQAPGAADALITFGHGTLDRDGLADLLTGAGVERLVDVRRFPGSHRNPAAKQPALQALAAGLGIDYRWDERLGGRRRLTAEERETNPDTWWRVAQFRAYAAWTRTPAFAAGLDELVAGLGEARTAIMCSEAVWWRCHRRIVADVARLGRGTPVGHLMPDGRLVPHPTSEGARVGADGALVWDGDQPDA